MSCNIKTETLVEKRLGQARVEQRLNLKDTLENVPTVGS